MNQIGKTEFLIKILNGQKPGAVPRLMEMINSLGLGVVDANITTFNGRVLSILRLEVRFACLLSMGNLINSEVGRNIKFSFPFFLLSGTKERDSTGAVEGIVNQVGRVLSESKTKDKKIAISCWSCVRCVVSTT